ncbi:hypothetical protein [Nocardia carnea]|uniref:GNAT family N-acetyltransferase n=1 Tax=Nocardia carnea TaxID=37328 RepID=A0ABW7TZI5_9NOCA|nr:hypothetical protein [Nocardia carnea]
MTLYLPDLEEIRAVALRASLRNWHPSAQDWLLGKIDHPLDDWDTRAFLTVPGVVWTVSSDTCATGRLSAPENVTYDHRYREFVFRQPRDEEELAAIMSADSEEVFGCYRFDGLNRWTSLSVAAWVDDKAVIVGYIRHVLATGGNSEILDCLGQYEAYLASPEFDAYLRDFGQYLAARERGRSAAGP